MDVRYDYSSADGGLDTMASYDEMLNRTFYDYEDTVIPSVGRKVYVVSVDAKQIFAEEVYAIGQESFIVKGYRALKENFGEFRYDDYFVRWFLDWEDAKKHLEKYLQDGEEIDEEEYEGVWDVKPL